MSIVLEQNKEMFFLFLSMETTELARALSICVKQGQIADISTCTINIPAETDVAITIYILECKLD